jgi:hypothetical protein
MLETRKEPREGTMCRNDMIQWKKVVKTVGFQINSSEIGHLLGISLIFYDKELLIQA